MTNPQQNFRPPAPVRLMYEAMLDALGPSDWWPGEHPFEVAVGAILTQNTNWRNVELALENLRQAECLTPRAMLELSRERLAELIRPSGFYRLKADRLGNFLELLRQEAGDDPELLADTDLAMLAGQKTGILRDKLLTVRGIGQETADAMLLYALDRPMFVVDAYTARIASRHGLAPADVPYGHLQELFTTTMLPDPDPVAAFAEYHALIVRTAKSWCAKRTPRCSGCPLKPFLP